MDGQCQVGIGQHDGGGLATQFQIELGDVRGRCCRDAFTGGHAAGKADHVHARMGGHGRSGRALPVDHVEGAGGQLALGQQLGEQVAVDGRFLAGLDDEGVAGHQGRCHLAGDQEERKIPRQDANHHSHRLAQQQDLFVGTVAGDDLALDAACPLGHVIHVVGGEGNLHGGQAADLALLLGQGAGDACGVVADAAGHATQVLGPFDGGPACPRLPGAMGRGNGPVHIALGGPGSPGQQGTGGGVGHVEQVGAVGEGAGDVIAQHGDGSHVKSPLKSCP